MVEDKDGKVGRYGSYSGKHDQEKKNNTLNFEQHSIMEYSKIYEEKSITSTSHQIHVLIAITAYNTKNVKKNIEI